ncbi:MAG: ribonuclease III domain-containing protein [Sporolactobacillus sp.]
MTALTHTIDPDALSSLALAFMGDAVLEVYVRRAAIASGAAKINNLHHITVGYVSAKAQADFLRQLVDSDRLTEAERAIVRRGRNAKAHAAPRHTDVQTYNYSTGFEALIGYLHFSGQAERLDEIMAFMFVRHPMKEGDGNE